MVLGEFAPNTPITVSLEGVATEDISSGEVEVALPTLAAMVLAGPDKRLRVVPGEKAPVLARWQVPTMKAGDTWKETFEVGMIAEKGYYQITAFASTQGTYESPYVSDDALHEAWMFVIDGGGFQTNVFEESVFPDHLVPQPGPFEAWISRKPSASSTDPTIANAMAAGSMPNTFHVYFYTLDCYNNTRSTGSKVTSATTEAG